jgi:hypothetical protein
MLRAALPAYAKRKGVKAEIGLRLTYKTKGGVRGTVVKYMTMDQSRDIRSWIGLCRDILSEIGRKHGYAGKNKVLSLDLLTVLPT